MTTATPKRGKSMGCSRDLPCVGVARAVLGDPELVVVGVAGGGASLPPPPPPLYHPLLAPPLSGSIQY